MLLFCQYSFTKIERQTVSKEKFCKTVKHCHKKKTAHKVLVKLSPQGAFTLPVSVFAFGYFS